MCMGYLYTLIIHGYFKKILISRDLRVFFFGRRRGGDGWGGRSLLTSYSFPDFFLHHTLHPKFLPLLKRRTEREGEKIKKGRISQKKPPYPNPTPLRLRFDKEKNLHILVQKSLNSKVSSTKTRNR